MRFLSDEGKNNQLTFSIRIVLLFLIRFKYQQVSRFSRVYTDIGFIFLYRQIIIAKLQAIIAYNMISAPSFLDTLRISV